MRQKTVGSYAKIQQTKIAVTKIQLSLKAETVYEGRLKVILLLQVTQWSRYVGEVLTK